MSNAERCLNIVNQTLHFLALSYEVYVSILLVLYNYAI